MIDNLGYAYTLADHLWTIEIAGGIKEGLATLGSSRECSGVEGG